ncbi:MAG: hypothetical protein JXB14_01530 [Candidatus Altiarchaeota archaeon]|nr:hypothetical protein [Candidatus Altiarchaeota archaeon]
MAKIKPKLEYIVIIVVVAIVLFGLYGWWASSTCCDAPPYASDRGIQNFLKTLPPSGDGGAVTPPEFGNDSEIGKPCSSDADCKLPYSYAVISRCPYQIRCSEDACEVFCPWDEIVRLDIQDSVPKSLSILGDRRMIFAEGDKTNQTELSKAEVDSLKQFILDNGFFSLNEKYEGTRCCDFIAGNITVMIDGRTHSVYCYNECPEQFSNIEERIKSLWPYAIEYYGFA